MGHEKTLSLSLYEFVNKTVPTLPCILSWTLNCSHRFPCAFNKFNPLDFWWHWSSRVLDACLRQVKDINSLVLLASSTAPWLWLGWQELKKTLVLNTFLNSLWLFVLVWQSGESFFTKKNRKLISEDISDGLLRTHLLLNITFLTFSSLEVCELLGTEAESLKHCLSFRRITTGSTDEQFMKPCSKSECVERRDCMAKLIYSRYKNKSVQEIERT